MLYAAYGSNLHPVRLQRRISTARLLGAKLLPGSDIAFHKRGKDGSGKCSIADGRRGVFVAVYEIEADALATLDRIEGVGEGYDKVTLDVPDFGQCHSYRASPAYIDDDLKVFDWYRQLVWLGCRFHGFPDGYADRILSAETTIDPDRRRRGEQWRLVATLAAALDARGAG